MEELFLDAEPREELGKGKVHSLRQAGYIPAIVYAQAKKPLALKVSNSALLRLVHQHRIEGVLISLKIKDENKTNAKSCLIKEIQYDPVHGNIIHVDFNEISLTKAIKVNVPVVAKGEPAGVKLEGGSLEHILWEVEIECLPTNIPKEIEVEVSGLKIGDSIHVKDLALPSGIKVLNDPGAIVVSVAAPMKEEVASAEVEGEVKQEPEVIKEKKEAPVEEGKEEGKEGKKEK